jgi:hypothetical protein
MTSIARTGNPLAFRAARHLVLLTAVYCLIGCAESSAPDYRTWTSDDGKHKTVGRLIEHNDSEIVVEKRTGVRVTLPLDELSASDQEFLSELAKREGAPAKASEWGKPAASSGLLSSIIQANVNAKFGAAGEFKLGNSPIVAVALSADASHVIACDGDGECRAWNVNTKTEAGRLSDKLPGKPLCVALARDSTLGIVGCEEGGVVSWTLASGKVTARYPEPKHPVTQLGIVADGQKYMAFDKDVIVHCVDVPTGVNASTLGHEDKASLVAFAPSGDFYCTASQDDFALHFLFFPGIIAPDARNNTVTSQGSHANALALSERVLAYVTHRHDLVIQEVPRAEDTRWTRIHCQVTHIRNLSISSDEQWVTGIRDDGQIEIWNLRCPSPSCQTRIDVGGMVCATIAADGMSIAFGKRDGRVSVWRLRERPQRRAWQLSQFIKQCFEQEDYQRLDALADELMAGDPEPFPWDPRVSKLSRIIYECVDGPDVPTNPEVHRKRLADWRAKHPTSVLAQLVEVQSQIRQAWAARGSGLARTVTDDGWKRFFEHLEQARTVLMPLMSRDDVPLEAYDLLLIIAKGENWSEDAVAPVVEQLNERGPEFFMAHGSRVEMLMPRWGGDQKDSEAYARKVADKLGGQKGDIMYARLATRLQPYYSPESFFEETLFDYERVQRGLKLLASRDPPDWSAVNAGLRFAMGRYDRPNAVRCANMLDKNRDSVWDTTVWRDAGECYSAKTWALIQ